MPEELPDEKLIEIGRAVQRVLQAWNGDWPRMLVFELLDHKRRLHVSTLQQRVKWSTPHPEDVKSEEVKFPNAPYLG